MTGSRQQQYAANMKVLRSRFPVAVKKPQICSCSVPCDLPLRPHSALAGCEAARGVLEIAWTKPLNDFRFQSRGF
jgi:hypothetical protein